MRKEDESKLNKNIENKMEDIKHELDVENKNRIEAFNELNSCLEVLFLKSNNNMCFIRQIYLNFVKKLQQKQMIEKLWLKE